MHPAIDQLLRLCDGEPVEVGVRHHVDACPVCAAEIERLGRTRASLRALPEWAPPPDAWAVIRAVRQQDGTVRRGIHMNTKSVAAAVVAFMAVISAVLLIASRVDSPDNPELAGTTHSVEEMHEAAVDQRPTGELVAQSRELEELLRALPQRRIERVATAGTIDTLEQRIQWVDLQLSLAPDAGLSREQEQRLWHERVRLMDSLVKVRYAEAGRLSF